MSDVWLGCEYSSGNAEVRNIFLIKLVVVGNSLTHMLPMFSFIRHSAVLYRCTILESIKVKRKVCIWNGLETEI